MIRITIQRHGRSPKEFVVRLNRLIWFELQEELNRLGEENHKFMRAFINASRKRPGGTGRLANAIDFNFWSAGYTAGFEIGKISELDQKAPYWKAINYGGVVPPPSFGYFFPGEPRPHPSYFREGRWQEQGSNYGFEEEYGFPMTPKKPIPAMNYIQRSEFLLRGNLIKMLRQQIRNLEK